MTPSGGAALGAKNVFYNGAACVAGELKAGVPVAVVYDGTQFNIAGSGLLAATQAQMEASVSTNVFVSPARQQFHPSASKFWLQATSSGVILSSYNVTSITDTGTGIIGVTLTTPFSTTNWCGIASTMHNAGSFRFPVITSQTTSTFAVNCYDQTATLQDPTFWFLSGFGDQ